MKTNNRVVAITGANGFLGSALIKYLVKNGWEVIGLVRDPNKNTPQPHVTYRRYDITEKLAPELLSGTNYLVHAAYIKQSPKHRRAGDLNIGGAKNLQTLSRKSGLKKNIFISSMSAHDKAISEYGKQKIKIEAIFNGKQDVSLRPGLIVGDGGIVKSMTDFMKSKHVVPLVGGGRQPLQIVSVDDLVVAIEKALLSSISGTLTIAHPRVYSYKEFYIALSKYLKTFVLFIPVPYMLLSAIFKVINILHLPLSIGEDNLKGLKMLRAAETARDIKKLGIKVADLQAALERIKQIGRQNHVQK